MKKGRNVTQKFTVSQSYGIIVNHWNILDPVDIGDTRNAKLNAYRITRDQILKNIEKRF